MRLRPRFPSGGILTRGPVCLCLLGTMVSQPAFAQPMHDECAQAQAVTAPSITPFSLDGATTSRTECGVIRDVWYELVAPVDGYLVASVPSYGGLRLSLYHTLGGGDCTGLLVHLACGSEATAPILAGETYFVRVGTIMVQGGRITGNLVLAYGPTPDDRYTMRASSELAGPGEVVSVDIHLDSQAGTLGAPAPLAGWVISLCHDTTVLQTLDLEFGATALTVRGGMPPVLSVLYAYDSGFIDAAVVDFFGVHTLPPGLDLHLYTATYLAVGAPGSRTSLEFCDASHCESCPSNRVQVVPPAGNSIAPIQIVSGEVRIESAVFVRGDTNDDMQLNIADAVYLSDYLFFGGSQLICRDAGDGNDDGTINVADIVTILSSLFGPTTIPLPAPYPMCGHDLTPDAIDCASAAACP